MSWYNYLFAAFAACGVFGSLAIGMPAYAQRNNMAGVIASLALAAFWSGIFYWNVFG